jgi:hypothetical protein
MTTPEWPYSTADELAKLASLLESGVLSDDEFEAAKARLLNGATVPPIPGTEPGVPADSGSDIVSKSRRQTRLVVTLVIVALVVGAAIIIGVGVGSGGRASGPSHAVVGEAIPFTSTNGAALSITVDSVLAPATAQQYQLAPGAAGR